MKKILNIGLIFGLIGVFVVPSDVMAAKAKKQSALQAGTKVRAKVESTGVYDEECYNKYFGCMDEFCISDNENGGTCTCSDDAAKYEDQLEEIKNILAEAERISTEEVERIQAGANADIIFNGGKRVYNEDGTIAKNDNKKVIETDLARWSSIYDSDDEEYDEEFEVGHDLYLSSHELCKAQMPDSCAKD